MYKITIPVLFFHFILLNPTSSYTQIITNESYNCNLNKTSQSPISDLIKEVGFIPLETKVGFLINSIEDVRIVNEKIYVLDNNNGNMLYIFDRYGKFLNKIDSRGAGPREYRTLNCFDVSRNGDMISIFDGTSSRLSVFDANCNFLRSHNLGTKEFYPNSFRYSSTISNGYVFSANVLTDNNEELLIFTDSILKIKSRIIKSKPFKINIPGEYNTFSSSKDFLYFYNNYDGTTYVLKDDKLISKIFINFSARMYLPEQITQKDLDVGKAIHVYGDIVTNYCSKISDDYIHSIFYYNKNLQILVTNRKKAVQYLFSTPMKKSCQCGVLFYPTSTTPDGKFIFSVDPVDLKDFLSVIDPNQTKINKTDYLQLIRKEIANDNPILFFLRYK